MKKLLKFLVCLLIWHTGALGQSVTIPDKCQSEEAQKKLDVLYPKMKLARQALNEKLSKQIQDDIYQKSTATYTIPIVFHVVHGGGAENITDSQIQEAVVQMNEDYNGLDPDRGSIVSAFKNIYANIGFKFVLARLDPNGNPTDGITRHYDSDGANQANGDEGPMKDRYRWPREKYLNVYVLRAAGLEKGSAWAYYPGVNETLDGVVSSHWAVGRTGTATPTHYKIMTHEVGHWANLAHTFQDGCEGNGDNVADTPPCTAGSGCNITDVSCGILSNRQNYMDYGTCTVMFTEGQKSRMLAAIEGSASNRNNLWTTQNLTSTGVIGQPVSALFSIAKNFTTPGGSIVFDEKSEAEVGNITSWSWSFPGGTPSSYNGKNPPEITYNTSGIYDVTLTVSNGSSSNTITKKNYINVSTNVYMHNNTLTIVNGKLYDEAYNGRYSVREDHTLTLLPGVAGTKLNVDFTTFKLFNEGACGVPLENDFLKIYDGPDTNSPLLGTYCASNSPGSITATNPQGALTFYFHTNVENREEGFVADISCKSGANDLPVANFSSSTLPISAYQSVTYTDQSVGATQWNWTFPGGSPATSTQQNPIVGYTTPGTYNVSLTVSNSNGSHTETKSNYIIVGTSSCESLPYTESFENGYGSFSQLLDDDFDWIRHIGATKSKDTGPTNASSGSYYLYTESTGINSPTRKVNIISKCLNLQGYSAVSLGFDYHMYGANMGSLEVQVSNDGGGTWETLWSLSGNQGNSWKTANVSLSGSSGQTALIRFNSITGADHTSDAAIDNISVTGSGSGDTQAPTVPAELSSSSITDASVHLSWDASSDNIGVTGYDIYQDNTSIGTVTGTSKLVTGLAAETTYVFKVRARDAVGNLSGFSNEVSVTTQTDGTITYCASKGNPNDEYISRVQIGTIDNTTTASIGGYGNYTSISTTLSKGSHTISITPAWSGTPYAEGYSVWIDYNQDGDFTDAGEQVWSKAASQDTAVSGNFIIPSSAKNGNTRMRVSMKYNGIPSPCESFSYGEVEDYTVVIGGDGTTPTCTDGIQNGDETGIDCGGSKCDPCDVVVTYCTANGNSISDEYISRVQLGSINNTSTGGTGGYNDFTSISTSLSKGGTHSITITPMWTSTAYTEAYSVWIDYNQDGDFADLGEQVWSKAASQDTLVSGNFTIPSSAKNGNTRMRVSMRYNAIPLPCGAFDYGEVEDYTVTIIAQKTSNQIFGNDNNLGTNNVSIYPNPFEETVTIDVSKLESNIFTIIVYNILGKELVNKKYTKNQSTIVLGDQIKSSGNYFVKIQTNRHTETLKLVKF